MTANRTISEAAGDQKRRAARKRVLKAGIIAFSGRCSTLPCSVRDFSEQGARLQLQGSIDAPDTFELIIEIDGIEADCRVVRRRLGEIAVEFTSPPRRHTPKRSQIITSADPRNRPTLRRKPIAP